MLASVRLRELGGVSEFTVATGHLLPLSSWPSLKRTAAYTLAAPDMLTVTQQRQRQKKAPLPSVFPMARLSFVWVAAYSMVGEGN